MRTGLGMDCRAGTTRKSKRKADTVLEEETAPAESPKRPRRLSLSTPIGTRSVVAAAAAAGGEGDAVQWARCVLSRSATGLE